MPADLLMPRLSDSMEEGTILKWLKRDGEDVRPGDELVEIETDKANMTHESELEGTLTIVAREGETLPVGAVIARIGEAGGTSADLGDDAGADAAEIARDGSGEAPSASGPGRRDEVEAAAPASPAEGRAGTSVEPAPPEAIEPGESPAPDVKASPVARRMARELGIDLRSVRGTGPGGRIVRGDVEAAAGGAPEGRAAASAPAPAPADATAPQRGPGGTAKGDVAVAELTRLQQTVARRMAESKATAPDFQVSADADMEAAAELRGHLKAAAGDRPVPSFNDMIVKAAALALLEFPRANGAYRDGHFESYARVNVGIAVAARDALVVPTVFDADRKSLFEIAQDARALAERVRSGAVTPPELSGGTFTVSNLGMYGMRSIVPVINPPQAAILGVGEIAPRAVARDGAIVARRTVTLTLVCDHRILYGADAAEFLARIRALLEQPYGLAF